MVVSVSKDLDRAQMLPWYRRSVRFMWSEDELVHLNGGSDVGALAECDKADVRREGLNGFGKIDRRTEHVMTDPAVPTQRHVGWYDRDAKYATSKIVLCAFSNAEM